MDSDSKKKLVADLAVERDGLNHKAAELERQAALCVKATDQEAERKSQLEGAAKSYRAQADKAGQQWMDLMEAEVHDDDRGGIER